MGKKGMGWVPDYPDVRDCTLSHDKVKGVQSSLSGTSVNEGFDDRAQQLLKLVTMLEKAVPNLNISPNLPELNQLKEKFQRDADQELQAFDQKLHFVSANFTEGFLSLGSKGKEVQDLQDKLSKLGYLTKIEGKTEFNFNQDTLDPEDFEALEEAALQPNDPDQSGVFGKATELAITAFQVNQLLHPTGIFTAITKAELLALVSIAGRLGQSKYRLGISGPGMIYIHALLQNYSRHNHSQLKFDKLDLFTDATLKAIQNFQANNILTRKDGDGIVGQETWKALIKNEDPNLRKLLPSSPVPKKRFNKLKDKIFEIIKKNEKEDIIQLLGGWEKIDQSLFGESEQPSRLNLKQDAKVKQRLEPIVEVLIQLTPCIGKDKPLETALAEGYNYLLSIIPPGQPSRLEFLVDLLEQGRGYVSSNIFRYPSYQAGVFGPAITYIQERLRALGYYNGPTTGYFDEQLTQDAVQKFQSARAKQSSNLNHIKPNASPPNGIFNGSDMENLTNMTERFINLEPPLPDALTDSLIADLGGLEEVFSSFKIDSFNINNTITKIQQTGKLPEQWVEIVQSVIPSNALNAASEATLKKVIQGINDLSNTPEESQDLTKQLLALLLRLTMYPIAKVIAQLISPIGKYNDPKEAFKDGLKRFKVIAYFSEVQEIDRILNGLIVDVSESINELSKEYEPLVETLAILKAEFRQQELSCEGLNVFEQLHSLVMTSLQYIKPIVSKNPNPTNRSVAPKNLTPLELMEKIIQQVKEWIDKQIRVEVNLALGRETKKISVKGADHKTDNANIAPRRDQTFIRVDPTCDRCSLQLPVTGKMYRALSQPPALSQSQQAGECNTTYATYLILPDSVDLSIWCSEVEDQGVLDACTAHAGVALLEYFEKKSFGNALDASSRFLYKVTRNLMHREGDTGASVRETMKAMVLFGVPPEEYCPYDEAKFDDDPSAFCYAFAQNYQTITYFRLDGAGMPARELLAQIKTILVGGFPCMFGFTVYDSIHDKTNPPGHIPYPTLDDKQEGGHAAIAVGYNDYKQIKNATNPGAFLIKNSWGVDWGEGGYGWLPYDYVLNGLARDWWSLIKSEWVESKQFGLSAPDAWTASLGETATPRTVGC
jgi:C1A family cysteine protease/peptidoglycan hydrolase-like protein with peptidoglycan-binding domain